MSLSPPAMDAAGSVGGLVVVSQFTQRADTNGGNCPSLSCAEAPDEGKRFYDYFAAQAHAAHPIVQTGIFAADVHVELFNDRPVTIPVRSTQV